MLSNQEKLPKFLSNEATFQTLITFFLDELLKIWLEFQKFQLLIYKKSLIQNFSISTLSPIKTRLKLLAVPNFLCKFSKGRVKDLTHPRLCYEYTSIIHGSKQNTVEKDVIYISNQNFHLRMRSRISRFSRKIMKILPRSQRITEKSAHCASDRVNFIFIPVYAQPESHISKSEFFEISEKMHFFTDFNV